MCLISVLPSGVEKKESVIRGFIEQGMSSNTDGSGYAFKKDGRLYVSKGYRSVDAIMDSIKLKELATDDELIIHHRIGTSGKRDNFNMHPFVVSSDLEEIKYIEGYTDLPIMAHNGVFYQFSDHLSDYSDTVHFIKDFVSTPEFISLIERDPARFQKLFKTVLGGSKLVFLFKGRSLVMTGDYKEDEGCYHSNGGYKKYVFDRGGSSSSASLGGGANTFRYPKHSPIETASGKWDWETMDEADWEEYNAQQGFSSTKNVQKVIGTGIDSKLEKSQIAPISDGNIEDIKRMALKFEAKDLIINSENYDHFILVLKSKFNSFVMTINKGYTIEKLNGQTGIASMVEKGHVRQVFHVVFKDFIDNCDIFVKDEFRDVYSGLFDMINFNGYYPSKSLKKKILSTLNKKMYTKTFKFKGYGDFTYQILNHYYLSVKNNLDLPNGLETEGIVTELDDYPEHKTSKFTY